MWNPRNNLSRIDAPALSVIASLFALGYIALAAWGWGGWLPLLAQPARAGVCAALVALAAATPLCGCNVSAGRLSHGRNDWIFPVLIVCGLAMGWISAYSDRHQLLTFGGGITRYCGLALFLLGCALRIASMLVLGPRFSVWVAVQEGHELQTSGLYRFVRHPSYTGAMLTLLGWAITFRSIIGLLLAAAMVLPLIRRIGAEEQLLVAEFQREYIHYRRQSWRLVPWVY